MTALHPQRLYQHVEWVRGKDSCQSLLGTLPRACPALQMLHLEGSYFGRNNGVPVFLPLR